MGLDCLGQGQKRQSCGDLKIRSAAVSLEWGLMALEAEVGSWSVGRMGKIQKAGEDH